LKESHQNQQFKASRPFGNLASVNVEKSTGSDDFIYTGIESHVRTKSDLSYGGAWNPSTFSPY
jgi:hypothetical protein